MPFSVARPVAFPLYGIVGGRCACRVEGCTRIGKHAAVNWGELAYGQEVPRPAPGAGVGLKTGAHPRGSDVFVVDLDGEAAAELFDSMGPCPETLTVATPRAGGGWHLYFKHPGFHVKTSKGDLGPKIDIRGDGGIVVAPGSPHESGGRYEIVDDSPPADAPPWLLEWLRAQRAPSEAQVFPGDVEPGTAEHERRRALYAQYLEHEAEPCVKGNGGDQQLFNVVQRGAYDLALPVDDVLELVREVYDPRCDPPWGDELEERVHHKARDAKENSQRPRAEPLPADLVHLLTAGTPALDFVPERPDEPLPTGAQRGSMGERWGAWDAIIPPPVYLLDGLIPEHKVVTFFAEGGSVKTWSALGLAIAVATGQPWLGKYGVKQGKALYLDYEDGPYEVSRRVRLLTGGKDVPGLGYLYGGPQIDQVDLWRTLAEKVQAEGIVLVVVDSLGAGMPGDADENTTAFAAGMKIAGRFTEVGCTVVFIHHSSKTGSIRGTSAIRDQSDVVFKFEPVSETDNTKRMRMVCDKPGPQKRPAPVNVELSDAGLRTFEDAAEDTARNTPGSDGVEASILLALQNAGAMTADRLAAQLRKRPAAISAALKVLRSEGKVCQLGHYGGFDLDSPGKRTARVLAAVPNFEGTAAGLAAEANVPTDVVAEMVKANVIKASGSGFVIR